MGSVVTVSVPAEENTDNEDAFALGDGVGVVVDGAGIPADLRAGCCHTVAWYANILATTFRDLLERRSSDMRGALAEAIAEVTASHQYSCRLDEGSPSATVAAWRLTPHTVEYLVLCDASIILSRRDRTVAELTDDRIARVTARITEEHTKQAQARGDALASDDLRAARRAAVEGARNRPGGFWCCQTDPNAASEAMAGQADPDAVRAVLAASDGATRGHQLLHVLPVTELVQAVIDGEAATAIETIRLAERRDTTLAPRGIKQHDDATLVCLVLDDAGTGVA
jgi:hypothetical protein